MSDRKRIAKAMEKRVQKLPVNLEQVPESEWPEFRPPGLIETWASQRFVVQVYAEKDGAERVSINRTRFNGHRFSDGIMWDELQAIKRAIGRGSRWAVEIYPDDYEIVNDANMRHLWLLKSPPPFAWFRPRIAPECPESVPGVSTTTQRRFVAGAGQNGQE